MWCHPPCKDRGDFLTGVGGKFFRRWEGSVARTGGQAFLPGPLPCLGGCGEMGRPSHGAGAPPGCGRCRGCPPGYGYPPGGGSSPGRRAELFARPRPCLGGCGEMGRPSHGAGVPPGSGRCRGLPPGCGCPPGGGADSGASHGRGVSLLPGLSPAWAGTGRGTP